WLLPQLPAELRAGLERRLQAAQLPASEVKSPSTLSELQPATQDQAPEQGAQAQADAGEGAAQAADERLWLALAGLVLLLGLGIWRGRGPRVAKGV
ncbi:hypothetical protein V2S84_26335, partial [Azotobacter chroococcum]|nr:hypothetical protein [Azotobacter chroococcum]